MTVPTATLSAGEAPPLPALTARRKAAMIVQLALAEGADLALSDLPEETQLDLTRELGSIRLVDRQTLAAVAEEFLTSLDGLGMALPGGVESALTLLGERISPSAAARARDEVEVGRGIDPWRAVLALPVEELTQPMLQESAEVAAVLLSKLPVDRAAALLGLLPGARARLITFTVSRTAGIRPEVVQRIGEALKAEYATRPPKAFDKPPVKRLGDILNESPAALRDAMLENLASDDEDFAQAVRAAIFTFADILDRVRPLDAPVITRAVDQEVLVTALAAAEAAGGREAEVVEFLLSNMSQRLADGLREEMAEVGTVSTKRAEKAWGDVVSAIRARAEAGEITLRTGEDEEED